MQQVHVLENSTKGRKTRELADFIATAGNLKFLQLELWLGWLRGAGQP